MNKDMDYSEMKWSFELPSKAVLKNENISRYAKDNNMLIHTIQLTFSCNMSSTEGCRIYRNVLF